MPQTHSLQTLQLRKGSINFAINTGRASHFFLRFGMRFEPLDLSLDRIQDLGKALFLRIHDADALLLSCPLRTTTSRIRS